MLLLTLILTSIIISICIVLLQFAYDRWLQNKRILILIFGLITFAPLFMLIDYQASTSLLQGLLEFPTMGLHIFCVISFCMLFAQSRVHNDSLRHGHVSSIICALVPPLLVTTAILSALMTADVNSFVALWPSIFIFFIAYLTLIPFIFVAWLIVALCTKSFLVSAKLAVISTFICLIMWGLVFWLFASQLV